ncbi:MAG: autotransporter domain-containing protein [Rhizobiaceae bacterium]|nr:autotransporter domain-containing protein [Rhizobiaceae bacterium]
MGSGYVTVGRRGTAVLQKIAFWISLVVAALAAESAWALTCAQVNGRTIQENDGVPATFNTETYSVTLEPGQSITFQATALAAGAQVSIIVEGFLVHDNPNTSYTLSNPGAMPLTVTVQVFVHETRVVATGNCGATTAAPSTSDEAANKRDALQNSTTSARPSSNPDDLPGSDSLEAELCAMLERRLGQLVTLREELEFELIAYTTRYADARQLPVSDFPGDSYDEKVANRVAELTDIEKRMSSLTVRLDRLSEEIDVAREALNQCRGLPGDFDPDELGDGEQILYAPVAERFGHNVPWPVTALGYAGQPVTTISTSSEHGFAVSGKPAKLWMRAQGSILDGTLGRTGTAGSLQAGFVVGVTPAVDFGFLAHILTGGVSSTTIGGSLASVAGGVGLYTKVRLPNDFRFGLSVLHEWGGHNITLGGATGFYTSSFWAVAASVSKQFQAGAWLVMPALSGTWNQITNRGYTDSNGLVVPATMDSVLYFSGKLDLRRPIVRSGEHVVAITPRFSVAANYFAQPARNLVLGGGLGTLTSSTFTIDIEAGLALVLAGGGAIDLALQARGLAGNERSYGVQAGVHLPLN